MNDINGMMGLDIRLQLLIASLGQPSKTTHAKFHLRQCKNQGDLHCKLQLNYRSLQIISKSIMLNANIFFTFRTNANQI